MKKFLFIILAATAFSVKAQNSGSAAAMTVITEESAVPEPLPIASLKAGDKAPDFNLLNVDDKIISFESYPKAKGFIIVFTCNGCPYAKAYEQRIIQLNEKYAPMGFPVIAINPNDPEVSEGDSFKMMKELAKTKKYTFPYLFDKGQKVTNIYGARATPHIFLVSKTANGNIIEYTGAIDNDTEDTNPTKVKYVENGITSLMNNQKPSVTMTKAIGCSVKRKA